MSEGEPAARPFCVTAAEPFCLSRISSYKKAMKIWEAGRARSFGRHKCRPYKACPVLGD